ncbi:hypothetical protein Q1695_015570 [Nippostrongylus brasiliensis]|nr:hypothetical protein Q1695_015570 [Nippostrongylus brasiliensis]
MSSELYKVQQEANRLSREIRDARAKLWLTRTQGCATIDKLLWEQTNLSYCIKDALEFLGTEITLAKSRIMPLRQGVIAPRAIQANERQRQAELLNELRRFRDFEKNPQLSALDTMIVHLAGMLH